MFGLSNDRCSPNEGRQLTSEQGVLSSFLSKKLNCGINNAPWIIEAKAGQTVEISLFDFNALSRQRSHSLLTCSDVYGFIVEKSLSINQTICGQKEREHVVYRSKTNKLELHLTTNNQANFLLKYKGKITYQ